MCATLFEQRQVKLELECANHTLHLEDALRASIERLFSGVLTLAAVAIAISVVWRTFFTSRSAHAAMSTNRPAYIADWKSAVPLGIRLGDSTARVTILELTDLECPACRDFQGTLQKIMKAYPRDVSVVYLSYPLPMHRFAIQAARAAECANEYGKFRTWENVVFDKQDSLGLKSWGAYALEAGISDTAQILRCATSPAPVSRIQASRAFGDKIQLRGTPTVIVNGWRFPNTPDEDELRAAIKAVSEGRPPFDTTLHTQS